MNYYACIAVFEDTKSKKGSFSLFEKYKNPYL